MSKNNKGPGQSVCKSHCVKNERDMYRVCPSKLSKRELEDLYFTLLESNSELKHTVNYQNDVIKSLNTRLQRFSEAQKIPTNGKEKECCTSARAIIYEQKDSIADLKKLNEQLTERIRILNMRLCSAKQFLRRCSGQPPVKKPPTVQVSSLKNLSSVALSSEGDLKTCTMCRQGAAAGQPNNVKDTPTKELIAETIKQENYVVSDKPCDENKCRTTIEELKGKISNLELELFKTHDEYSERITHLEQEVSRLQAENIRVSSEKAITEQGLKMREREAADLTKRLNNIEGQCNDQALDLSLEKSKVAELETHLKAAQLSTDVASTIEGYLAKLIEYRKDESMKECSCQQLPVKESKGRSSPVPKKSKNKNVTCECPQPGDVGLTTTPACSMKKTEKEVKVLDEVGTCCGSKKKPEKEVKVSEEVGTLCKLSEEKPRRSKELKASGEISYLDFANAYLDKVGSMPELLKTDGKMSPVMRKNSKAKRESRDVTKVDKPEPSKSTEAESWLGADRDKSCFVDFDKYLSDINQELLQKLADMKNQLDAIRSGIFGQEASPVEGQNKHVEESHSVERGNVNLDNTESPDKKNKCSDICVMGKDSQQTADDSGFVDTSKSSPAKTAKTPKKLSVSRDVTKLKDRELSRKAGASETPLDKSNPVDFDKNLSEINTELMKKIAYLQRQLDEIRVEANGSSRAAEKNAEVDADVKPAKERTLVIKDETWVPLPTDNCQTCPDCLPQPTQDKRGSAKPSTRAASPGAPRKKERPNTPTGKRMTGDNRSTFSRRPLDGQPLECPPLDTETKVIGGDIKKSKPLSTKGDDHNLFQIPGPAPVEARGTKPYLDKTNYEKKKRETQMKISQSKEQDEKETKRPQKMEGKNLNKPQVTVPESKGSRNTEVTKETKTKPSKGAPSTGAANKVVTNSEPNKYISTPEPNRIPVAETEKRFKTNVKTKSFKENNKGFLTSSPIERVGKVKTTTPLKADDTCRFVNAGIQWEPCEMSEPMCVYPPDLPNLPLFPPCCDGPGLLQTVDFVDSIRCCNCYGLVTDFETHCMDTNPYQPQQIPETSCCDSHPHTYVLERDTDRQCCGSADNTDNEISSLTDLPSEKDEITKDGRLSPGECRHTTTYSESYSAPTSSPYQRISDGEVAQRDQIFSPGETEGTGKSCHEKEFVQESLSQKMEATLQAITEELVRCRYLLETKKPTEVQKVTYKDVSLSTSEPAERDFVLKKAEGSPHIGDAASPKCVFTVHIGTVVLSDEAVMNSRDMALMLSWKFYDQQLAMARLSDGRVQHFDFSTQYDLNLTQDLIDYLKYEEMPILICDVEQQQKPFARCVVPLRNALTHVNRRADMSLTLLAGPHMWRTRYATDSLDAGDEVGVLDLWCMLQTDTGVPVTPSTVSPTRRVYKRRDSFDHSDIYQNTRGMAQSEQLTESDLPTKGQLYRDLLSRKESASNRDPSSYSNPYTYEKDFYTPQKYELPETLEVKRERNNPVYYDKRESDYTLPSSQLPKKEFRYDSVYLDSNSDMPKEMQRTHKYSTPHSILSRAARSEVDSARTDAFAERPPSLRFEDTQQKPPKIIVNEVPTRIRTAHDMKQLFERKPNVNEAKEKPLKQDNSITPHMDESLAPSSMLSEKSLAARRQFFNEMKTRTSDGVKSGKGSLHELLRSENWRRLAKCPPEAVEQIPSKDHSKKSVKIRSKNSTSPTAEPTEEAFSMMNELQSAASQIVSITVLWLALNEECEAMADPSVTRLYVAYNFLGRDGADLETPVSLPKPKQYVDKCYFNFKKTFKLTETDFPLLGHLARCRHPRTGRLNAKDCIVFAVVSEPPEDPLGLDSCEDVGYAYLYLGELLACCEGDSYTEVVPIHTAATRGQQVVCGVLAIRVDGLNLVRRCSHL